MTTAFIFSAAFLVGGIEGFSPMITQRIFHQREFGGTVMQAFSRRDILQSSITGTIVGATLFRGPKDVLAADPFNKNKPDRAEGLEDNFWTRADRGTGGEINGVAPPPTSRDKDGSVQVSLQAPGSDDIDDRIGSNSVAVTFTSPWKQKRGSVAAYGDASKNQDAFVALRGLPKSTATAPNAASLLKQEVVLEAVLGRDSRFGAYGAPTNVKVLSDKSADADGLRILDVSFTTQGAQLEVDKHVLIGCRVVKAGASPVLALVVAGSSKAKWGESQEDAKTIVESFKAM